MDCQSETPTRTLTVTPGAAVCAALPRAGVLRLQRAGGAMAGTPAMAVENGALALYFADGASITLTDL